MGDHRQWTSVRDNHIQNINNSYTNSYTTPPTLSYNNSLQNENCVMTDDIVNLDDDDETDAIEEAEKLLDQLDLLSSSDS